MVQSRLVRQGELRASYGFDCACGRCLSSNLSCEQFVSTPPMSIEDSYRLKLPSGSGLVSVPNSFAEYGSYVCFLPSQKHLLPLQGSTVLNTEIVGTTTIIGVSVSEYISPCPV